MFADICVVPSNYHEIAVLMPVPQAATAAQRGTVAEVTDIIRLVVLLGRARPSMGGIWLRVQEMMTTSAFVHPCCIDQCRVRAFGLSCRLCREHIASIHEIVHTAYVCMFAPIDVYRNPSTMPCPGNVFYSLPRSHIWVAHPGQAGWASLRDWWMNHFVPVCTGFAAMNGPAMQHHQQTIYRLTLAEFVNMPETRNACEWAFG